MSFQNCVIFAQYVNQIAPYAQDFLPIKFFSIQVLIKNPRFQLPQNVPWTYDITRVISASTGINGVS